MNIILFYNFNSPLWLTGIVEVVSTCSHQPKLITCSKNDNNNYNVPFLHVFNWKSNKHKQPLQRGDRLKSWTSESDVYRRQILTSEIDPRAVRIKIFIMAVDPYHRHSNKSERADKDIYDDFKLKKNLWFPRFSENNSAL